MDGENQLTKNSKELRICWHRKSHKGDKTTENFERIFIAMYN